MRRIKKFLKILGPGFITGAADDDPSGIATYSQTGAQFGYGQLWTVLFIYPLMTAVQEASARIGAVTGKGLAAVVRENFNKKILYFVVLLVFIANTINIGADIGAMAAAANLIIPLPFSTLAILFTVIILSLEIFTSYKIYSKILKWLVVSLIAYPITAFIVSQPWGEILKATFLPHFEFSFGFLFIITAVLGTTISPYLFFWEASEEVEEEIEKQLISKKGDNAPHLGNRFIKNLRLDNMIGMLASQITTWFIIIVAATVLHSNNIINISTAADAARALEPLVDNFPNAGFLAKTIFAIGIIGLGLLAVPILAGSASYAISETFNWHEGLYRKLRKAHGFYGVIILATVIGLLINFIGIDPIKALIFAAVFNGVVAVPLIFIINKIAGSEKIMGEHKSGSLSKTLVLTTFIVMLLSALAMFATFILK
ncbi:MAG: Nramp family divalent metal transporter [bacterium]|nr:Nramp family divalent metal transporter [bacterium]